jgi:Winged helix-turn-helix DNA-binding
MNVLDDLKKLEASIVARYQELQPALTEVEELRRVAERLGVDLDRASTKAAKPATATRTRTRRSAAAPSRRKSKVASPRRPRAGGRREQVLKLVTDRPGITVPEIGKALGVDPTGLYRYAKQLEADGSITKSGTKLSPAGS